MVKHITPFLLILGLFLQGCYEKKQENVDAVAFVSDFESDLKRLDIAYDLELWKQASTGKYDSLKYFIDQLEEYFENPEFI